MPSSPATQRAISRCVSSAAPHASSRSNHSSQPRPVRSRIAASDVASTAPASLRLVGGQQQRARRRVALAGLLHPRADEALERVLPGHWCPFDGGGPATHAHDAPPERARHRPASRGLEPPLPPQAGGVSAGIGGSARDGAAGRISSGPCDRPYRRSPRRPRARRSRPPRTRGTRATPSGSRAPTPRTRSGATATSSSTAAPRSSSSYAQVGARARVRAAQGPVGVQRQPHRRPLPVRVPRRVRPVVAQLRQRAVGVRRGGLHAPARGEHQRRRDRRVRAADLRAAAGERARRTRSRCAYIRQERHRRGDGDPEQADE